MRQVIWQEQHTARHSKCSLFGALPGFSAGRTSFSRDWNADRNSESRHVYTAI
jgi:hypothetical protein